MTIFESWRMHFVFTIAQLKLISSLFANFFNWFRFVKSNIVFVKNDINRVKFYKIKRFIDKRQIARRNFEYFVKWKSYDFENNVWKNISKLNDVINFVQKYNASYFIIVIKKIIKFSKNTFSHVFSQQKSTVAISFKSILHRKKSSTSSFSSIQSKVFVVKFNDSKFILIFTKLFAITT